MKKKISAIIILHGRSVDGQIYIQQNRNIAFNAKHIRGIFLNSFSSSSFRVAKLSWWKWWQRRRQRSVVCNALWSVCCDCVARIQNAQIVFSVYTTNQAYARYAHVCMHVFSLHRIAWWWTWRHHIHTYVPVSVCALKFSLIVRFDYYYYCCCYSGFFPLPFRAYRHWWLHAAWQKMLA